MANAKPILERVITKETIERAIRVYINTSFQQGIDKSKNQILVDVIVPDNMEVKIKYMEEPKRELNQHLGEGEG